MEDLVQVKALESFYDRKAKVNRAKGEEFEATAGRISEMNACGKEQCFKPLVEISKPKRSGRPTKAELLEEASKLGLEVPEGATNPQIAEIIAAKDGD